MRSKKNQVVSYSKEIFYSIDNFKIHNYARARKNNKISESLMTATMY